MESGQLPEDPRQERGSIGKENLGNQGSPGLPPGKWHLSRDLNEEEQAAKFQRESCQAEGT